jgi:hypothetical protein
VPDTDSSKAEPEEFRIMYCSCGTEKRAANDAMLQAVADELCGGKLHQVITAVVYKLQNYSAQVTGVPSDMWSAVITETEDGTFRTRIECDIIEHGFAGTWLAFKQRFPEGSYGYGYNDDELDE